MVRYILKDDMLSIGLNNVWDLVELSEGNKHIRCKWVFKLRKFSMVKWGKYKTWLIAKCFS